jgi:hypothetical protein
VCVLCVLCVCVCVCVVCVVCARASPPPGIHTRTQPRKCMRWQTNATQVRALLTLPLPWLSAISSTTVYLRDVRHVHIHNRLDECASHDSSRYMELVEHDASRAHDQQGTQLVGHGACRTCREKIIQEFCLCTNESTWVEVHRR